MLSRREMKMLNACYVKARTCAELRRIAGVDEDRFDRDLIDRWSSFLTVVHDDKPEARFCLTFEGQASVESWRRSLWFRSVPLWASLVSLLTALISLAAVLIRSF